MKAPSAPPISLRLAQVTGILVWLFNFKEEWPGFHFRDLMREEFYIAFIGGGEVILMITAIWYQKRFAMTPRNRITLLFNYVIFGWVAISFLAAVSLEGKSLGPPPTTPNAVSAKARALKVSS